MQPVFNLHTDRPTYTPYPPGWSRTTPASTPPPTTAPPHLPPDLGYTPFSLIPSIDQLPPSTATLDPVGIDFGQGGTTFQSPVRPPRIPSPTPIVEPDPESYMVTISIFYTLQLDGSEPCWLQTTPRPPDGSGRPHLSLAELVTQLQEQLARLNATSGGGGTGRLPPVLPTSAVIGGNSEESAVPTFNSHLNIHGIGIIGGGPYAGSFGPSTHGSGLLPTLAVHSVPAFSITYPQSLQPPERGSGVGSSLESTLGSGLGSSVAVEAPRPQEISAPTQIYRTCKDGKCRVCLGSSCYDGEYTSVKVVEGCPIAACDEGCFDYQLYSDNCPVCRCNGFVTREPCRSGAECLSGQCVRGLCRYPDLASPQSRLFGDLLPPELGSAQFAPPIPPVPPGSIRPGFGGFGGPSPLVQGLRGMFPAKLSIEASTNWKSLKCEVHSDCGEWEKCGDGGRCEASRRRHVAGKRCVLNSHCPRLHFCEDSTCWLMERAATRLLESQRRWEALAKGAQTTPTPLLTKPCVFHFECPSRSFCDTGRLRCEPGGPSHRSTQCLDELECRDDEVCRDMSCLPADYVDE